MPPSGDRWRARIDVPVVVVLTLLVLPALYRWLADAPRREQAPEVAKQGEGA